MKIEYLTGNLFEDAAVKFVAHCCNAQGRMGSGFAKELRERNPSVYETYRRHYLDRGLDLGGAYPIHGDDGRIYFNIIGQEFFGYDGARYVSYDALATAFEEIDSQVKENEMLKGMDHLAMPLIGAGLAGGKWSIIASIIEQHSTNYQPIVYLLDGKVPS